MGVIKNRNGEEFILLNAEHVVGRNHLLAHTIIEGPDVSRSHATFSWKGHKWILQDHSLNGTMVNRDLINRSGTTLKSGDTIKFGQIGDVEWELIDAGPPVSYLKKLKPPLEIMALASRPGIAMPDNPSISFYLATDQRWRAEVAGMVVDLMDGVKLKFDNEDWQFVENGGLDSTINLGTRTAKALFNFTLSPDEERIAITLQGDDWRMEMGERAHNYLLLILARKRIEDAANGYHGADQGWLGMDAVTQNMAKEFRKDIDEYQVNLHIHRIRKQLLALKPYGYLFTNIVERRKGEVRFAHPYLDIQKEGKSVGAWLQAELMPEIHTKTC